MHRKNILDSSNSMCKGPAEEKNLMCLKNLNEATLTGTWGLRKTMTSGVSWKTGEASGLSRTLQVVPEIWEVYARNNR